MIIQEFLFAILIALIITMVFGLYRLGQLINAVEDRAKILQIRLLDMMKTPQQREYEEKMIDMFIDELNKKGKIYDPQEGVKDLNNNVVKFNKRRLPLIVGIGGNLSLIHISEPTRPY